MFCLALACLCHTNAFFFTSIFLPYTSNWTKVPSKKQCIACIRKSTCLLFVFLFLKTYTNIKNNDSKQVLLAAKSSSNNGAMQSTATNPSLTYTPCELHFHILILRVIFLTACFGNPQQSLTWNEYRIYKLTSTWPHKLTLYFCICSSSLTTSPLPLPTTPACSSSSSSSSSLEEAR